MALVLVPFLSKPRGATLEALGAELAALFGVPCAVKPVAVKAEHAYDLDRGQYDALALLRLLLELQPAQRVLGIVDVDLFIPMLTFVFGQAQLNGRAALVSTYRLENALYGLPRDESLFCERLRKEAVHELGHTYGLVHCADARCVMHSATFVEEIDLRDGDFCSRCRALIADASRL